MDDADGLDLKAIGSRPLRMVLRAGKDAFRDCNECLSLLNTPPNIVLRNADKAFTFDFAFPSNTTQSYVYDSSVKNVVQNLFKGYNVTVVAYGQTGSGKTHTMGTAGQDAAIDVGEGIIPRAVRDIFAGVVERDSCEFLVKVSFIELYKEDLFDLLTNTSRANSICNIHEDPSGGIKIANLSEVPVTSLQETMMCLEKGAQNRATGATAMNATSSRSHAIFSLHVEMKNKEGDDNVISAKFHMVDLAGSERAKKTGATGERFKEGVNINKGLLALGNVISALCEDGGRRGHIPYRDSKLTRLLQDSLGGNSHTVMIACVSPADSNFEETLSTLRYADRARKIKNKPIVNRDPQAAELAKLRAQVQQLQVQLLSSGTSNGGTGGSVAASSEEIFALLEQNKFLQSENDNLTRALQSALDEATNMAEKALMSERGQERLKTKLLELECQADNTLANLNKTFDPDINPQFQEQINLVKEFKERVTEIQCDQKKQEKMLMDHEISRHNVSCNTSSTDTNDPMDIDETSPDDPIHGSPNKTTFGSPNKTFGTQFTLRQAKLQEELHEINRNLALKEELMSKMTTNDSQFVAMKLKYEKEKKDLESHIDILAKERDELTQQLRSFSKNPGSMKIAEQRRKRVKELEEQINGLKKKQAEQAKMLKMKQQTELKVNRLSQDVLAMKQTKVKLIRQMKEDNEKFRVWKAQKDREVMKLKTEDRKKQNQIVKIERMNTKQQNVLRRKMEEAVAINKRLKEAMALQKACNEKRANSKDVNQRVKSWLDGEMMVVATKKQAKHSLQSLVADRKFISEQLNKIKRQLKQTASLDASSKAALEVKENNLNNDLQLRTAQMSELQSKLLEEDEEAIQKKRFESMQSMGEAKVALQHLFDKATTSQANHSTKDADFKELQIQYDDMLNNNDELEAEMKTLKENNQSEITQLARQHEDKVLLLLRQMQRVDDCSNDDEGVKPNPLQEKIKFLEEELARFSTMHEELHAKTEEVERLKKEMVASATKGNRASLMPDLTSSVRRRTVLKPKISKIQIELRDLTESESSDEDEEFRKNQDDPDWQKTPLYNRIRAIIKKNPNVEDESESEEEDQPIKTSGAKRSSSGEIKCKCKGDCTKKLCTCRKNVNACGVMCGCNALACKNRTNTDNSGVLSTDNSEVFSSANNSAGGDTLLNSTFDVGLAPLKVKNKKAKLSETNSPSKSVKEVDEENTENESPSNSGPLMGMNKLKKQLSFTSSPSMF
ncbi:unnamed protein product, partial [Meganyctiphanes norvegica]